VKKSLAYCERLQTPAAEVALRRSISERFQNLGARGDPDYEPASVGEDK
jgi:hypothetical protein